MFLCRLCYPCSGGHFFFSRHSRKLGLNERLRKFICISADWPCFVRFGSVSSSTHLSSWGQAQNVGPIDHYNDVYKSELRKQGVLSPKIDWPRFNLTLSLVALPQLILHRVVRLLTKAALRSRNHEAFIQFNSRGTIRNNFLSFRVDPNFAEKLTVWLENRLYGSASGCALWPLCNFTP